MDEFKLLVLAALVAVSIRSALRGLDAFPGFAISLTYCWLQATAGIVVELVGLRSSLWSPQSEEAVALSLLGVLSMALGYRAGHSLVGGGRHAPLSLEDAVGRASLKQILVFWALGLVLALGTTLPGLNSGARALVAAIVSLRMAPVVLLFSKAITSHACRLPAVAVFLVELTLGFTSYFSGFKFPILAAALAACALLPIRRVLGWGVLVAPPLLLIFSTWQAVKDPYRLYLAGGVKQQQVVRTKSQSLTEITVLVSELKRRDLVRGFESGLQRLAYVDIFGHAIRRIPSVIPHQGGSLWIRALMNPLQPRILFPDKVAYNDSVETNSFTGLNFATHEEGVSVSMGWNAESYVDFGARFMFAPIFLLGLFVGAWGRALYRTRTPALLTSLLFGTSMAFSSLLLETSLPKLTGSLAIRLLMVTGVVFLTTVLLRKGERS